MLLDHLTDIAPRIAMSNTFSNAPVIGITTLPDQYFAKSHYADATNQSVGLTTPNSSIPPTPGSIAGRKRSRGDIFAEDEDLQADGSLPTPAEETASPMIMGSGMTLVSPDAGYAMSAESQSGTWLQDRPQHAARPSISSRKSQRRDTGPTEGDNLAHLVLPNQMREATTEPLIDEATRVLGISWTRMDSSEALLINQAAYSKFIQKHYSSLNSVTVWFENSALPGYLVVATNAYTGVEEFYIFSHDLLEARLVTRDPSDLLPRLQLLPNLEAAAPGGNIKAETDSATVSQNEVNDALQTASELPELRGRIQDHVYPRGRSAEPAHRFRELLCTAHEMELD